MKHLQRLMFVGLVLVMTLVIVPASLACTERYQLSNKTLDCERDAELQFDYQYDLLQGSEIHTTTNWHSAAGTVPAPVDETITLAAETAANGTIDVDVPADGYVEYFVEVFGPDEEPIYSMYIYAECPSGVLRHEKPEPGVQPPAANEATLATVLFNTPLYSAPSYDCVLPDYELEVGQTWFVLRQVEDEEGNVWNKIFVGSRNYAYVPADTMLLGGPLPE